jgi:hypothetical protein
MSSGTVYQEFSPSSPQTGYVDATSIKENDIIFYLKHNEIINGFSVIIKGYPHIHILYFSHHNPSSDTSEGC